MAREKPPALQVKTFATHHVITQPNPLRRVIRRVDERDLDDPVARAEKALAGLSGEFEKWMSVECQPHAVLRDVDHFAKGDAGSVEDRPARYRLACHGRAGGSRAHAR